MTGIVLAGALAGIGLFLLVIALQRPQTRGSAAPAALARMDSERSRQREVTLAARTGTRLTGTLGPETERRSGVLVRQTGLVIRRQLDAAGIRLPAGLRADLSLLGRPVESHLALTLFGALLGGGGLLVFSSLVVSVIPGAPLSTPLVVTVIGAIVGGLLPTAQAASRATVRRRDFRHVVGSFLDLVALNLSGGRGVPEALNSASSISDGWAMVRLRDCLQMARLQGVTPWLALGELGQETGVAELRDLSAALELVADDGAKVRESLAARAASLRRRELADAEGRAQARSQSMLVAQLLLAVGFLVFLIYPAITRVLSS
jgi:Flp pilus assembly protein TadB